jgi:hypothetical protein
MKKAIIIISLLIFTYLLVFLIYNFTTTEETITDQTLLNQLAEEMNLDYILNLDNYPSDNSSQARLLEAGMRLAKKYGFMHEESNPEYIEYVAKDDLHLILKELTGKSFNKPIVINDFYYQYDEEKDRYFVIPVGSDWKVLDSISKITSHNGIYTVECKITYMDEDMNEFEAPSTVKLKYIKNNKYIKYRIVEVKTDLPSPTVTEKNSYYTKNFGKSENGRDLIAHIYEPKNFNNTILLNFAIHGFEDAYPQDGQVLVDAATFLMDHYSDNIESLKSTRLIIVPCANPDGLMDGTTNNGFGRCNANGVDLNRDFDANHIVLTDERNKTLEPFSASESRALRDLVLSEKPNVVIDFHGWLNYTIGDGNIAQVFADKVGLQHKTEFNENCNGYFSYWASLQNADALLVEFENDDIPVEKLIEAIDALSK